MASLFFTIFFLFLLNLSSARDTLLPAEFLYSNQSLVSPNGLFRFGFIDPGKGNYYLGIWLTTHEAENGQSQLLPLHAVYIVDVVWIANTKNPITKLELSKLSLSENGTLLLTQSDSLIWSSNAPQTEPNSTKLALLDTGNLVLQDQTNSSVVTWQSFDHPTKNWLPGARLGFSTTNGENIDLTLISSKTTTDLSPGLYSFEIDQTNGIWGFVTTQIQNQTQYFGTFLPWMSIQQRNNLVTFNDTTGRLGYLRLDSSGNVFILRPETSDYCWLTTGRSCWRYGIDGYCGPFGMCLSQGPYYSCECPSGFHHASAHTSSGRNFSAGCTRSVSLSCSSIFAGANDTFTLIDNIYKLPDNSQYLGVKSKEECESACRSDCSCTAYASGAGCNLWYGNLMNAIIRDDGLSGQYLYLRVGSSGTETKTNHIKYVALIGGGLGVILVVCLILFWLFRRELKNVEPMNIDYHIRAYSYKQLKRATKNFSTKLGQGGFGIVFKGKFLCSTNVAVKKLEILGKKRSNFEQKCKQLE